MKMKPQPIALLLAVLLANALPGQSTADLPQVVQQVKQLETAQQKLSARLRGTENVLAATRDSLAELKTRLAEAEERIGATSEKLGTQITTTGQTADQNFAQLRNSLAKNTWFWVAAILCLAGLGAFVFSNLKKRFAAGQADLADNIRQTRTALEEEGVKLDNKLVGLLETQMSLIKEARAANAEPDHSLALKVADEIVRIQQNLAHMAPDTRGLKQLAASVTRIRENFEANRYELVDMLNKPYDLGMKVTANFRPDETLRPGEQIITRIIKPQVNFKGVMIQSAQIEVSMNE